MIQLTNHKNQLLEENRSLRKKNAVKTGLIVLLTIVSALSMRSCCRNMSGVEKANKENKALKKEVEYFKEDALNLSLENLSLKNYANDAHIFVNTIHPPYPTEMDGLTAIESEDEMIKAGAEAKKKDEEANAEYEKSCKTLGIDQETLIRLQKGWERE